MSLKTYAGIRVKHLILSLVSEILKRSSMPEGVTCEPVYYAQMDATALRTHRLEDGEVTETLVVFRVQRPSVSRWEIHVMAKHSGRPDNEQVSFDFDETSDASVYEAVMSASWAMLQYLEFCTFNCDSSIERIWGSRGARHVFAAEVLERTAMVGRKNQGLAKNN